MKTSSFFKMKRHAGEASTAQTNKMGGNYTTTLTSTDREFLHHPHKDVTLLCHTAYWTNWW